MNNPNMRQVVIDVWGDFGCFTRPESKVERLSYPCMTPSAARNILCSIYLKPPEFYYEIERIEVINDVRYMNVMRNELKEKVNAQLDPIYARHPARDKGRTQRNTYYLRNCYYRIYAKIVKRNDWHGSINAVYEQFCRRVRKGQCFRQPFLGTRECVCHFSEPDYSKQPNPNVNITIGTMLYDVFNITSNKKLITGKDGNDVTNISFFHADIVNGVLQVPAFHSRDIWRAKDVETDS